MMKGTAGKSNTPQSRQSVSVFVHKDFSVPVGQDEDPDDYILCKQTVWYNCNIRYEKEQQQDEGGISSPGSVRIL